MFVGEAGVEVVPVTTATQDTDIRSIDIWRVENDRFVEHWDELNTLDVFVQIGAARLAA